MSTQAGSVRAPILLNMGWQRITSVAPIANGAWRQIVMHARRWSVQGNLNARYIDLVEDNRTLLEEIDKLSAKLDAQVSTIKELEQVMAMIAENAVFKSKCDQKA